MAPRLRTKPERVVVAGLVALALLALGEQAPAAFPVHVTIEGHAANVQVSVDGQTHSLSSALGGGWQSVLLEQPGPLQREYQIDGSDTTSTGDRDVPLIRSLLSSPLYRIDAFLRDDGSYSRWENLRITDLGTGQAVSPSPDQPLPSDFRVDVSLRRPEAAARVWLVVAPDRREGLELDRDKRNARWLIMRGQGLDALPRWFFPEEAAPFAAALLWLLGRSAGVAYVLGLAALALRWLLSLRGSKRLTAVELPSSSPSEVHRPRGVITSEDSPPGTGWVQTPEGVAAPKGSPPGGERVEAPERVATPKDSPPGTGWVQTLDVDVTPKGSGAPAVWTEWFVGAAALGFWLVAAALVSIQEFHQLPHILDAVSYTFQAGLFASGQLSLPAPPQVDAFRGPFTVVLQGRLFSQYPPGAPAMYALGRAVNLEWLAGPVACAVLIGATAWSARTLFGLTEAITVLGLGIISPFVLFQAGSYLSHPVAAGLLAAALASFVAGECRGELRWYAVCGALLGAAFMAREVASVLFAVPLGVRLLATRRWHALGCVVAFGLPFVFAYLVYNLRQTGNPLLLPRMLFNASDHFGFGNGVGFHTRHTLAAGLANTDELLTILQFDAFGWPPLFLFAVVALPFLCFFLKPRVWDWLALAGFLAFVVAYVGYFYHGVALGPRYYFEAMPWLLLLAARGASALAGLARTRVAPLVLLGALSVNTFAFYLPAELARRQDMSGLPGAPPLVLTFVEATPFGPRLHGVPDNTLVLTSDWWIYNTALAPLNCPRLPDCTVLFALATTADDAARLQNQFPERTLLRIQRDGDRLGVVPF